MTESLSIKTAIMEHLAERYDEQQGAIEVAALAQTIGYSAKLVALACSELCRAGHVIGDGNLMGFVVMTERGRSYLDGYLEMVSTERV